jgi:hypothetical protein
MLLVLFTACILGVVGCTGHVAGLYVVPTAAGDKTIERTPVEGVVEGLRTKHKYTYNFIDKNGKLKEAQHYMQAEEQLFEEYGFPEEIVIDTGKGPKKIKPTFCAFSQWDSIYPNKHVREYDVEDWEKTSQYKGEAGIWRFTIENERGEFRGRQPSFYSAREELYELYGKPACFPSDTLVVMEKGSKPISQVRVGDQIMSLDENGDIALTEVVRTYEADNNHYYLINNKVKVTGLHRFLTSAGWKRAYEISIGDEIRTSRQDDFEEVISMERIATKTDFKVYNLQVSHAQNFIISPDGQSTYVVHNTGNGGGNGDTEMERDLKRLLK